MQRSHQYVAAVKERATTARSTTRRFAVVCPGHLGAWLDLVREVRGAPHGMAALVRIMKYIFATNEPDKPEELVQRLLAAVGEEGKEEIMTAADQLMERGREQGIKLGRREMLLDQLRERFGVLPDAAVARVTAAGMTELQAWSKRVLTAPGLDAVFAAI